MHMLGWVLVAVLSAGGAKPALPALARYEAALAKARKQPRVNGEDLYALALSAGAELLKSYLKVSQDQLAGKQAEPAVTKVQGLVLSWKEVLYAEPDPRFFVALTKQKGRPEDKAFFERLLATKPEGTWPSYYEQQSPASGCVRFEARAVAPVYSGWLDFRKRFPKAYTAAVARELDRAEQALSGSCACGTKKQVADGLAAIAKALPGTKAAEVAKRRLAEVEAGSSGIQFECTSG